MVNDQPCSSLTILPRRNQEVVSRSKSRLKTTREIENAEEVLKSFFKVIERESLKGRLCFFNMNRATDKSKNIIMAFVDYSSMKSDTSKRVYFRDARKPGYIFEYKIASPYFFDLGVHITPLINNFASKVNDIIADDKTLKYIQNGKANFSQTGIPRLGRRTHSRFVEASAPID
jgi:hypothetical protein